MARKTEGFTDEASRAAIAAYHNNDPWLMEYNQAQIAKGEALQQANERCRASGFKREACVGSVFEKDMPMVNVGLNDAQMAWKQTARLPPAPGRARK